MREEILLNRHLKQSKKILAVKMFGNWIQLIRLYLKMNKMCIRDRNVTVSRSVISL